MAKFRKVPVVIDALRFVGDNLAEVAEFTGYEFDYGDGDYHDSILIETLEGDMTAAAGDWIIRGVAGELYPCKPSIFDQTYEPAGDEEP